MRIETIIKEKWKIEYREKKTDHSLGDRVKILAKKVIDIFFFLLCPAKAAQVNKVISKFELSSYSLRICVFTKHRIINEILSYHFTKAKKYKYRVSCISVNVTLIRNTI